MNKLECPFDYFKVERDGDVLYVAPNFKKVSDSCYFRVLGINLLLCPEEPTPEDIDKGFYYIKHPEECQVRKENGEGATA